MHDAVAGRLKATLRRSRQSCAQEHRAAGAAPSASKWDRRTGRSRRHSAVAGRLSTPSPADAPLALPDKPSIAVLPFQNMSGDPEQEYFTDGITEDIITELSRFHSLFVIARNSSFSYKGKSPDIRQVGRELGVRYVLEGSIRKASNRIRVTGQLVDTLTGNHIWAERYDRVLEDIFAVQEEVTQSIVRAIAPHIFEAEVAKGAAAPPGQPERLRARRPCQCQGLGRVGEIGPRAVRRGDRRGAGGFGDRPRQHDCADCSCARPHPASRVARPSIATRRGGMAWRPPRGRSRWIAPAVSATS